MNESDSVRTVIWKRRMELEKARRDYMKTAMAEYDVSHNEQMKHLREKCGAFHGHQWSFTEIGPLGHAWFHCRACGSSKTKEP